MFGLLSNYTNGVKDVCNCLECRTDRYVISHRVWYSPRRNEFTLQTFEQGKPTRYEPEEKDMTHLELVFQWQEFVKDTPQWVKSERVLKTVDYL